MPLDPEIARFLEWQKSQPPRSSLNVEQTRRMMDRMRHLAGEPPAVARVEDIALTGGIPAREYDPQPEASLPLLLFFHGGRFFSGSLDTHDVLCRSLALAANCRIVAVDYRLAPERPFPAAVEDACSALEWGLNGAGTVGVAGDSAGANLAAVAALALKSRHLCCQVLIYPMLDPACSMPSHSEFASGYGPGSADMARGWREYLPHDASCSDPRACPLLAEDLSGLPPAFILTAEYDSLRDEGEAYASRLVQSGVPVTLRRYEGVIHGFVQMPGMFAAARRAIAEAGAFVRSACLLHARGDDFDRNRG